MGRLYRIYLNAVLGGIGGLLGWMLAGEFFGDFFHKNQWNQGAALAAGAIIGGMIGYFVVSVDAILDRSLLRFCRFAAVGILLGSLGGAAGYWVGDWVNYVMLQNIAWADFIARGLGWALFGLAIGISEGIAARSFGKFSYGAIGGTIGGFLGGVVYAWLMQDLQETDPNYVWGQATGLVIIGACIGSLVALVEEVLKPASLKVLRGWQEGREYAIVKSANTLGRDEGEDILLLRDRHVEKHHAVIQRRGNRFFLQKRDASPEFLKVNDAPVLQSQEVMDGDRLQLGNTLMKFSLRAARSQRRKT